MQYKLKIERPNEFLMWALKFTGREICPGLYINIEYWMYFKLEK